MHCWWNNKASASSWKFYKQSVRKTDKYPCWYHLWNISWQKGEGDIKMHILQTVGKRVRQINLDTNGEESSNSQEDIFYLSNCTHSERHLGTRVVQAQTTVYYNNSGVIQNMTRSTVKQLRFEGKINLAKMTWPDTKRLIVVSIYVESTSFVPDYMKLIQNDDFVHVVLLTSFAWILKNRGSVRSK